MTINEHVHTAPGRLGGPGADPRTDPRVDPRVATALAAFGLDGTPEPSPVNGSAPRDVLLEFMAAAEAGMSTLFDALVSDLSPIDNLQHSTRVIDGPEGNALTLHLTRTADSTAATLPCVVHLHGGGMSVLSAADTAYVRFRDELAATGLIVIGVEFRNAAGALGPHPFPAGLNDVASALSWVHHHRMELGISSVIVQGESGGGNLAVASALKANAEGRGQEIDGVYAMAPFISGAYHWSEDEKLAHYPSLIEYDGYFLPAALIDVISTVYDPGAANAENPLTWPGRATVTDLTGLPPHVISVNECDPLRDDGLSYYRQLHHAGVDVTGRMVLGTCHSADAMFRSAMPDMYAATIHDIHRFATRCATAL
jgi:acetyl esterase